MIELGLSKMALIGAVALIVIGPEKLPRVARTVGTLMGKAQRYVADVKAEVNRAMDLDELKKMKESVEEAGREIEKSVQSTAADFEKDWSEATDALRDIGTSLEDGSAINGASATAAPRPHRPIPAYRRPDKNWRLKRGATPQWYKRRHSVRRQVQSGAARVARYRPKKR